MRLLLLVKSVVVINLITAELLRGLNHFTAARVPRDGFPKCSPVLRVADAFISEGGAYAAWALSLECP